MRQEVSGNDRVLKSGVTVSAADWMVGAGSDGDGVKVIDGEIVVVTAIADDGMTVIVDDEMDYVVV